MTIYNKLKIAGEEYDDDVNIRIKSTIGNNNSSSSFTVDFINYNGRHSSSFSVGNELTVYADRDELIMPIDTPVAHYKMNDDAANTTVTDSSGTNTGTCSKNTNLMKSLVGHWKMNDNLATTAVLDNTANANNGTAQQNTEDISVSGKVNESLSFNGSSDYITLPNQILNGLTKFSFSAWGKIDAEQGNMVLYQERQDYNHQVSIYYSSTTNRLGLLIKDGDSADVTNYSWDATAHYGEWHHFLWTFDAGTVNFYLDGIRVVTDDVLTSVSVDTGTGTHKQIGRWETSSANSWDGSIDEVRIYNRALTPSESATLYNSGSGTEDETLDDGKINGALYFDGVGDYIDFGANVQVTSNFSFSTWIKHEMISDGVIYSESVTSQNRDFFSIKTTGANGYINVQSKNTTGSSFIPISGAISTNDNLYHHIIISYDGTNLTSYIDGILDKTGAWDNSATIPTSSRLGILIYSGTIWKFNGSIDDVRIYNAALSVGDASRLYNEGRGTETQDASDEKVFTGIVEKISFDGKGLKEKLTISGRDFMSRLTDALVEPEVYTNQEVSTIVEDLIHKYVLGVTVAGEEVTGVTAPGGTFHTMGGGIGGDPVFNPTTKVVSRVTFSSISVFDAIKFLAELSDSIFWIDNDKQIHFEEKSQTDSGFTFDNTNVTNAKFKTSLDDVYNRIFVYGSRQQTRAPQESFDCDGGSVFELAYKPHDTQVEYLGTTRKGGVFNFAENLQSGTEYYVDFDDKNIIFVSGTDAEGDFVPVSGGSVFVDYDRSVPLIKFSENRDSVEQYGPRTKWIVDKEIRDGNYAKEKTLNFLKEHETPKIQGVLTLQGIASLTAGEYATVNIPNHDINNESFDMLEVDYHFNKKNNAKDEVISVILNKRDDNFIDTMKSVINDVRNLQSGDISEEDLITRYETGTGSFGVRTSGLVISTSTITQSGLYCMWDGGDSTITGTLASGTDQRGLFGAPNGSPFGPFIIQYSGGYP